MRDNLCPFRLNQCNDLLVVDPLSICWLPTHLICLQLSPSPTALGPSPPAGFVQWDASGLPSA